MKLLGQALMRFARRPAVQMACVSFAEHATVCFFDAAIVKLKRWEKSIREFDDVVTIKGS
jgi:hypothetical protein